MKQYSCASRGFEGENWRRGTARLPNGCDAIWHHYPLRTRSAAAESSTDSCALLMSVHIARVSQNRVEYCPFGTAFDAFNGTGGRCMMVGGKEVADDRQ
ncbi:hypothetical protein GALMADRAFT_1032154 [Galerina marginata CBS 339.88]|uniref:Uncharacterized protein n=1 Tax=Galerina marginata (strain CBS 339.88) TaxID=685588 RepID=A0A067SD50_GALM3|nr:hypothetical protein GALMADRAFT_1032154 [Galerina marginata CBS 339.88]